MNLNIEGQIPIISKIYRGQQIYMPVDIQEALKWNVGDKIEMFATTEGIFLRKQIKGGE